MKAKFNQILANFGKEHVRELQRQREQNPSNPHGTGYFPGVNQTSTTQLEYGIDKENDGDALNIKIAGRKMFGEDLSPREDDENQK